MARRAFVSSGVKRWVAASFPNSFTALRTVSIVVSWTRDTVVSWLLDTMLSWCRGCMVATDFSFRTGTIFVSFLTGGLGDVGETGSTDACGGGEKKGLSANPDLLTWRLPPLPTPYRPRPRHC